MAVPRRLISEGRVVAWTGLGDITLDSQGRLHFPEAPRVPGLYRYIFTTNGRVVAGYIGETGRRGGLHARFRHYRQRGVTPNKPPGTTSNLAVKMMREIAAGHNVSVEVFDGWATRDGERVLIDLFPKSARLQLERELVKQLRDTGIEVINKP